MPFDVLTMTALTTSPFLTVPPGVAALTDATITSPMLPYAHYFLGAGIIGDI